VLGFLMVGQMTTRTKLPLFQYCS